MLLPEKEIVDLTRKVKYAAQARELDHLGIPYKARRDGSLIVMRADAYPVHHVTPTRPQVRRLA